MCPRLCYFGRSSLLSICGCFVSHDIPFCAFIRERLVLTLFSGTITKVDWDNENGKPEDTPEYYYNYQEAVPIEDVLKPWIKRFADLDWIPWNGPGCGTGEILRADLNNEDDRVNVSWPNSFSSVLERELFL